MKPPGIWVLLLTACFCFAGMGAPLCAQEKEKAPVAAEPAPYEEDEFPPWALSLRRGEIILIGSYPITLLVSSLTYSLIRFGINGFAVEYAPPPFSGAGAVPFTQNEIIGVTVAAAGVSLIIAVIDYFVFDNQQKKKSVQAADP